MIRTFHAKIDPLILAGCLLPSTVLAVFFFWSKQPIPALIFLILMVLVVERLIHTSYILTDEGVLWIDKGRFARKKQLRLEEIAKVELYQLRQFFLIRKRTAVLLTLKNGSTMIITPFPAEEFCHVLLKKMNR